jgi:predicted regulator of Ras-like GTPase activity (Roadblock/LC7/MglB family)
MLLNEKIRSGLTDADLEIAADLAARAKAVADRSSGDLQASTAHASILVTQGHIALLRQRGDLAVGILNEARTQLIVLREKSRAKEVYTQWLLYADNLLKEISGIK